MPVASLPGIRAAALLDGPRRALLRAAIALPFGRHLLRHRAARLEAQALFGITLSLVATLLCPIALLALGPVLYGVPHLAADVRYLLARPDSRTLSRRAIAPLLALLALMTALRALRVARHLDAPAWDALELSLGALAAALAALAARGGLLRRAAVALAACALGALAWRAPALALLAVAHGHNLVAFAFYLRSARRARARALPTAALYAACLALLAFAPLPTPSGSFAGLDALSAARQLAPDWLPEGAALRLLATFIFAQSVHYLAWMRLVPTAELDRQTPLPFAASLRRLAADLGRPGLLLTAVATVAVAAAFAWDFSFTRYAYFSLAVFHGYLEIASLSALAATSSASGTRP